MFAIRTCHTRSRKSNHHSRFQQTFSPPHRWTCGTWLLSGLLLLGNLPAAAVASVGTQPGALKQEPVTGANQARIQEAYGKLPLRFEANEGQTDSAVKFLSRGNGYNLFLTPTESVVVLNRPIEEESATLEEKGSEQTTSSSQASLEDESTTIASRVKRETAVVRMQIVGANHSPAIRGEEKLSGTSNYFRGSDSRQWRTGMTNYKKVRYAEIYPGVDLVYYGNQRKLEYDFVVQPGADPKTIALQFSGAEKLSLDEGGNLILETVAGRVTQQAPVVYQERDGQKVPVAGQYELGAGHRVGFEVAAYDTTRPLVIDPVLVYSTFLGGSNENFGRAIAVDPSGHAYVTGYTASLDFPTTAGAYSVSHNPGYWDAFVTKLNPAGSALVYSTFLGGNNGAFGQDIVVDASGNAYVTGRTDSSDFPTTPGAYDTSYNGGPDAFVSKLNPTGSALVYSTFLGGENWDHGSVIAVDASGSSYVTGFTYSPLFPTTAGAYETGHGGSRDAFVSKLNPTGSTLVYSTFLGGGDADGGSAIVVDPSGSAYVAGRTWSSDFPTTAGAYGTSFGGRSDAFVSKLNPTGSALVYSTFLGGNHEDSGSGAIAVDASGSAYVAGGTWSSDFPTTAGAYETNHGGRMDTYVTKLNPAGSALVYSTFLGGNHDESGSVAVDALGNAYVTGITRSSDFPTTAGAYETNHNGGVWDAFVSKLNSTGSALIYSSFLGGDDWDYGVSITLDALGNAYVTGQTKSTEFPTTAGAYEIRHNRVGWDAYITKFEFEASEVIDQDQTEGDLKSDQPAVSADGRVVAFSSLAKNLVPGDTNQRSDVFVHDRSTGTLTRVSVASDGTQGNQRSWRPALSAQGRYVVFESDATTLVSGDTNGNTDVFLHDRQTQETTRVSVPVDGGQGDGPSTRPVVSPDGRLVAFASSATNLVVNDTNSQSDIFVYDRDTETLERVSVESGGIQWEADSTDPAFSADGTLVVFTAKQPNNPRAIYVHDRESRTTELASVNSLGVAGKKYSQKAVLSGDGQTVVFESLANNFVQGDRNRVRDIFVRDLNGQTTIRISEATDGTDGDAESTQPAVNTDGSVSVFSSLATNLVEGDTNSVEDVFVYDAENDTIARVSVARDGTDANGASMEPVVSADGRYVVFTSVASNLVASDTNGQADVFVYDRQTGTTTRVSVPE